MAGVLPPAGPEIRHLTVTTGDIDRMVAWYAQNFAAADPLDEALVAYLLEMREGRTRR